MVAENLNNYFIDSVSELLHQEANGYDNNVVVSESIERTLQETNDDNFESSHSEKYDLPELTIEYLVKEIELLSTKKSTGSDDISVKILKALRGASNVLESLVYISNLSLNAALTLHS